MSAFLQWLGKRRPTSLDDQGRYAEEVSRPKAEPVAHDDGPNVSGHRVGRSARARAAEYEARHRRGK